MTIGCVSQTNTLAHRCGPLNEFSTREVHLPEAYEWKVIQRVPRVQLLRVERGFVLNHTQERIYFAALAAPLADIVVLLVDTGLCLGEALSLDWAQVHLEPT